QGVSGTGQEGCRAPAPARLGGRPPVFTPIATNASTGRFPDGTDTASNCNDFLTQGSSVLRQGSNPGATNIKVARVADFGVGQTVMIDDGANRESAVIAAVGTPGASTAGNAVQAGATIIEIADAAGFGTGQSIVIDQGANQETAMISAVAGGRGGATLTVASPLAHAHAAGVPVAGTGITLRAGLTKAHASGAQIGSEMPTPGAPNAYFRAP